MKLPVWLQVALALTVAAVLWTLWRDETPAPDHDPLPHTVAAEVNAPDAVRAPLPPGGDLFPWQGPPPVKTAPEPPPRTASKPQAETPRAPQVPFKVSGAWWQGKQRFLLLSEGSQSWLLCQQCKLPGAIRSGEKLNENWQLQAIAPDYLVLRWLPLNHDQRLPLGEMQHQPEF